MKCSLDNSGIISNAADLREGEFVERRADALLAALHGGRALRCVQLHYLVVFNHYTVLKKERQFWMKSPHLNVSIRLIARVMSDEVDKRTANPASRVIFLLLLDAPLQT